MIRRFLNFFVLALAFLLPAPDSLRAGVTNPDLVKSVILENDVTYLRVSNVGENLAEEIGAAQRALPATNKIAGTILDLRFAGGDDPAAAAATAKLFVGKKLPLAILVNDQTRETAITLAASLRTERAGLIFGSATAQLKPDITVASGTNDGKSFMENPYTLAMTNELAASSATNDLLPFVDHMSEAQLVRERRKDNDDDQNSPIPAPAEPNRPVIRDPVLARAVDLIKGLAVVNAKHN